MVANSPAYYVEDSQKEKTKCEVEHSNWITQTLYNLINFSNDETSHILKDLLQLHHSQTNTPTFLPTWKLLNCEFMEAVQGVLNELATSKKGSLESDAVEFFFKYAVARFLKKV